MGILSTKDILVVLHYFHGKRVCCTFKYRKEDPKWYVFHPNFILITLASGVIMDTIEFQMHLLNKEFSFKLNFAFIGWIRYVGQRRG